MVVSTTDPSHYFQGTVLAYNTLTGTMEIYITKVIGDANFPSDMYEINLNPLDGPGVPVGGNAGDILTKVSGLDYDTSWIPSQAYVNTTAYVELYYQTIPGSNVNNLPVNSISNTLPANFSASISSGAIILSNSNITSSTSNYLLMPTSAMVMYASPSGANLSDWVTNPRWLTYSMGVSKLKIIDTAIQFSGAFDIQGVGGSGSITYAGNGNTYKFAIVALTFNRDIC